MGDKRRGVALGIAAGLLAGNVCFVKCSVGLVTIGLRGDWSPWTTWLPYALVLVAACVGVGSVPLMLIALREYEAIFMVTLFSGCSIVTACVSGNVVLLEMAESEFSRTCYYWCSVALIISGLLVINNSAQGIRCVATKHAGDNARLLQLRMEESMPSNELSCEFETSSTACATVPAEGQVELHSPSRPAHVAQLTTSTLQGIHGVLPGDETVDVPRTSKLDKVPTEGDNDEYVCLGP